ncbi:hypothetical protein TTHERM_01044670 (macronuclear) [Tetrahymena thermophila SB210]|uniref:Uncharacterized protein n=1 Tax=Tetrahymena thermophila (strain SB210) TaxID=312017 RepID=Q22CF2_TETTS|nr:hypothetical protein TTHERM_01044670 [Tetrahymena thermophila SB210]EAR82977.2 hypothetical protein TTHERM_01044670 [Tetrahymena thermophila SB210]|eukprot:XP_001030640.2 hypothetical protein TTHERM_01044670 [Tetrahymena thermophila SB210]
MEIEEQHYFQNHQIQYQPSHYEMQIETPQQQIVNMNEQHNYQVSSEGQENCKLQESQNLINCNASNSTLNVLKQKEIAQKNKDSLSVYSLNSSSSSSSSSVKKRKPSNNFDIESALSQNSSGDYSRQVDYKLQPIYKQLFPNSFVHIFGDMVIHTDINNLEDYIGINSPFNYIKKIQQIQYKKANQTLEVLLDKTNTTFIDYDHLIQLFSNYPEKTIHELGKNLERYKCYSIKQQKMVQICSQQEGYAEFTRLKQVKFERFKQKAMEIVDQYKNEYICYIMFQRNYDTGGAEMRIVGLNEKLISLLGTSVNDFEELTRRVGMYCFQNKYIYNYILSKYIEQMGETLRKSHEFRQAENIQLNRGVEKAFSLEYQTSMLTIDDFMVDSTIRLETYVDCTDEDSDIAHDLLKFRDMLHIFRINITDETINTLRIQRLGQTPNYKDIIQKESLYYELEASIFLEKFYGPKRETQEDIKKKEELEIIQKQKTCGFRQIS